MERSRVRLRRLALGSVAAAACVLALATAAMAEPGFGARATIPMPTGLDRSLGTFSYEGLSCPTPTSCVTVGPDEEIVVVVVLSGVPTIRVVQPTGPLAVRSDLDAVYGLVPPLMTAPRDTTSRSHASSPTAPIESSTETSGTWGAPTKIALPAGAVTDGQLGPALFRVACTSVGNCEAVGEYPTASTGTASAPMLATETDGTWSAAEGVLPSGATTTSSKQDADLAGIVCPSAGSCVATGHDTGTDGLQHAYAAVETSGSWASTQLPDPTGLTSHDDIAAGPLACTDAADCRVLGELLNEKTGALTSILWTESSGVWSAPASIAPASDRFSAYGFACPEPTTCLAVGARLSASGRELPAYAAQTSGVWGPVATLPLPQLSPLPIDGNLAGIACSDGTCEATADFLSLGGGRTLPPLLEVAGAATWTGGTFSSFGYLRLPLPRHTFVDVSEPSAVVCPAAEDCLAVVDSSSVKLSGSGFTFHGEDVSVPISPVRTVEAPQPPATVRSEGIRSGIVAEWEPPVDDGGAPVASYQATVEPGGRTCSTRTDGCAFHGLVDGHRYQVSVTDRTSFGRSARVALHGLAVAGTAPDPPRALRLREVAGRLVASWHAAATLPGEPVEHYDVIVIGPHGFHRTIGTKADGCTFRVQSQGSYAATVLARNVSGFSKPSRIALATYRRPTRT